MELVECKNGYQSSLLCRVNQWVSDHAAHDFIENKQENQIQCNRDRRHKVKTSTVCIFSIDQRRCNKDYLVIIRHRFQCADISLRCPYLCPLFIRYVFAVYRPQFGIQIAQRIKVALHRCIRAKRPYPLYIVAFVGAELIGFLNRRLCRPFPITNTNLKPIREKDKSCICLNPLAIDCD